jgi:phosphoesterase RecJ-like protein
MNDLPDNIKSIIRQIDKSSSFMIVSHENPDGDSLGAQLAMALGLRSLGKKAFVRCKDPVPKIYDFLPGQDCLIVSKEVKTDKEEVLLVLDCGDLERTGIVFLPKPPPVAINIDHHISNNHFGHINWVNPKASATSEMVFLLLRYLDVKPNASIATNLYTGILTDTGSFQYSNTTAQCLNIASQLVSADADPNYISSSVYDRKSLPGMKLIGQVLNDMEIHHNQSTAILTVTREILKDFQATYEDTEELVSLPQKISSIKITILIKEIKDGEYKISFRSKGKTDVAQLAERLGGGGHPNAAGAKMNGKLSQIKGEILKLSERFLCE